MIISMKDPYSAEDEQFDRWLRHKTSCFEQAIPRVTALQVAAYYSVRRRSFWAKYPGQTGRILRQLAIELLNRLAVAQMPSPSPTQFVTALGQGQLTLAEATSAQKAEGG